MTSHHAVVTFSWFLGSSLIYAASQWAVIVLLSRHSGSEIVGEYSYAVAVSAPIIMFSRLNLRNLLATDSHSSYRFETYLATRGLLTLIAGGVILVLTCIEDGSVRFKAVLAGVALLKCIESISDLLAGYIQRVHRVSVVGIAVSLRGVSLVICVAVAMFTVNSLILGVMAACLVWMLILLLFEVACAIQSMSNAFDLRKLRPNSQLIMLSLPTGFVMLVASVSANIPIYVIESIRGLSETGQYAVVGYFLAVGGLISGAWTQSVISKLAIASVGSVNEYKRIVSWQLAWGSAFGALGVLVSIEYGSEFLRVLYGEDYTHLADALTWVFVAVWLSFPAGILGLCITIARRFYLELTAQSLACVAIGLVAMFLVPSYGVVGGAQALATGACVRFVLFLVVVAYDMELRRKYETMARVAR